MKYIKDLLYNHDCVTIPGLGAFISSYKPAQLNEITGTFFPPSKAVIFNENISLNDGLLIHYIVESEQISYPEAEKQLAGIIKQIQSKLEKNEAYEIENVGFLRKNEDNKIYFTQYSHVNYLNSSYGFSSFTPIKLQASIIPLKSKEIVLKKQKTSFSAWRWAAVLLPAAISLSILFQSNSDSFNRFNREVAMLFKPGKSIVKNSEKPLTYENFTPVKSNNNPVLPQPKVIEKPAEENKEIITKEKPVNEVNTIEQEYIQKPFHIMIGAFLSKQNAVNLVNKMKQSFHDSKIVDKTNGGLYRVSIDSYAKHQEALEALQQVRTSNYPSAWMMKRSVYKSFE